MSSANKSQIDCWNGRAGEKWARLQAALDRMLTPVTAELKDRAGEVAGQRVLDIGCGTGETCAIWLEGGADVTGVDVSAPMLAVAEKRTGGRAMFVEADASCWMGHEPFDLAVSRFGLMFFDDPDAAFATIAANIRPGGKLLFSCWRPASENEWVSKPMGAVRDLLPEAPSPVLHAPGPFALCDKERLTGILGRAGFEEIRIESFDFSSCLSANGGLQEAVPLLLQVGPTGAALAEASVEVRANATKKLMAALAPHDRNGLVTLGGAIWLVEAIRPH